MEGCDMQKKYITDQITWYCQKPENALPGDRGAAIFDLPVIGFASAGDPLFLKLKEQDVVGPHHKLPREWLPEAKTVISYFLPFSAAVRTANRKPGLAPAEWLYGRLEGEEFNDSLRRYIVDIIQQSGGKAVAPALEEDFAVVDLRSNWSERHVAFIAGLGTFGLSRSLITIKGCAGRFGSVVTSLEIEPGDRNYGLYHEFCKGCLKCVKRCPSRAIRPEGKDVKVCSKYLNEVVKPRFAPRYGCGKCQTALPCESSIPGKR